jgi:hypothetical protein
MSEMCSGVRTLVARMESNPEEFFGDAPKWRFMFAANFREVLTEPEKGALHEALKEVRRKEFDTLVVKEILKEEMEDTLSGRYQFGGEAMRIDSSGKLGISTSTSTMLANTLRLGNETLNEDDIKRLKASTSPTSTGWFK